MKPILFALAVLIAIPVAAQARDRNQVYAFRKNHPCPATGKRTGACPGYVVDHVVPLCLGGPDKPSNMQWQTTAASMAKDKREKAACACARAKRDNCPPFKP